MDRTMKMPLVKEEKVSETISKFNIKPYERGFGTTIGNALRRVLLSSVSRFAPVAINLHVSKVVQTGRKKGEVGEEISVAKHELDVLPGIRQDVYQIILNVKQLIFKLDQELFNNDNELIEVKVEDVTGTIRAKDLVLPAGVQVVNSDLLLMEVVPNEEVKSATLRLHIERGRGYWTSTENKEQQSGNKDLDVSTISIDSNFSPVKRVAFNTSDLAGFARSHEELNLEIETDGSISPQDVLEEAGHLLMRQFELLGKEHMNAISLTQTIEKVGVARVQPLQLEELGLDKRTLSALKKANIRDFNDLASKSDKDLMDIEHLGEKSIVRLREIIDLKKGTSS